MTINPTANLAADTRYTVRLTGGIRDAALNALVPTSWTFLTGAVPVITARAPANNATGASLTANLTVTFSEAVNGVSGTTFVLRRPDGSTFPSVVSRNGTTNQWILNPTGNLLADTRYTVVLTGPVPTVTTRTPAVGATGASRTANITTTLSEAPLASSVNATTVVLTNTATGAAIAKVTSVAGGVITINPNATLAANTQFTVRISGVTDVAGNPLALTTWNFRTGA
jgi:methionine-rich copper-binding protein CopC